MFWSFCKNCNNISNIPKVWRDNLESKNPINLIKDIYLLTVFKYSDYQIYDNYFIVLYRYFQLIKEVPAILFIYIQSIKDTRAKLLQFVCINKKSV